MYEHSNCSEKTHVFKDFYKKLKVGRLPYLTGSFALETEGV
jgi:hypothetical protein